MENGQLEILKELQTSIQQTRKQVLNILEIILWNNPNEWSQARKVILNAFGKNGLEGKLDEANKYSPPIGPENQKPSSLL